MRGIATLNLKILVFVLALMGASAIARADNSGVTISGSGKEVVLSNGIVTATVDVAGASLTSVRYQNHEMVSNAGRHRSVYFSRDGGAGYETVSHCVGSITTQTADTIDYACKHVYTPTAGDKHAWNVEVHFAVRRGVPAVYLYAITTHPASFPEMGVGEWRMVWSTPETPNDWLEQIFIDEARHWEVPAPNDFAGAKPVPGAPQEVSELTTGTWAGRYDCKYMYAASYYDSPCWGFASDKKHLGGWVVLPSHEWFNDGPNKQDLTSAVGTTLLHLNMNHYDGTGFSIPQGKDWHKFYGPWLLYFNDKPTAEDNWHDAQQQVQVQAKQWPYAWIKNPEYPSAAERGSVTGQLVVTDPLKPKQTAANAWAGLSGPADVPNKDFQFEASGYQFWARAGADGKFEIPHVRPGTYTLYAYTTGIVGQFEKASIVVKAGAVNALGKLAWTPPHAGRQIAWEIGVPDRTAAEFGHGKDYYLPVLYKKLEAEVPEPLDFIVGKSDPATDWFYAQCAHLTDGKLGPSHWRIHFNLSQVPAGPATLILAIAGDDRGRIGVSVNDNRLTEVTPTNQGGNGLVREAVHTKYGVSTVTIPNGSLRAGENVITLTIASSSDQSYVMYDYLCLETP